nr:MAG TPA: hypothetical protein [Caudoviricetes sp.]
MFSLKQSDRSTGGTPKIAVDSALAHAVATGFQHPLEPSNVITLCAFLQVASGLHIRTRRRNFRLFGRIGNSRLVHIVQHRGRELSPFGPFAIFDARFDHAIIETSRFNRPDAVDGNADMSAVPDDQTERSRNRVDRACRLTQAEHPVGGAIRAAVCAVFAGGRTVGRPEESLDQSDTVGRHALFGNVLHVSGCSGRTIMAGILLLLSLIERLCRRVAAGPVPVYPAVFLRIFCKCDELMIRVFRHVQSSLRISKGGCRLSPHPRNVHQFHLTSPVVVVTI